VTRFSLLRIPSQSSLTGDKDLCADTPGTEKFQFVPMAYDIVKKGVMFAYFSREYHFLMFGTPIAHGDRY
jgi:hypothetical protein